MWDWGTVPAWANALTGLLAFGAVIYQQCAEANRRRADIKREAKLRMADIARERNLREADQAERDLKEKRAQAEKVSVWIEQEDGPIQENPRGDTEVVVSVRTFDVWISNRSSGSIYNVEISLGVLRGAPVPSNDELAKENIAGMASRKVFPVVPPGVHSVQFKLLYAYKDPYPPRRTVYSVGANFYDASNAGWSLSIEGSLSARLGGDEVLTRYRLDNKDLVDESELTRVQM